MHLLFALTDPWPWYVAGPIIGLMVPILLLIGNKTFGISSSLRHICAACVPNKIEFFNYDWKKEIWNLYYVAGIALGGVIASQWMASPNPIQLHPSLISELQGYGINNFSGLVPIDLFNVQTLLSLKGFFLMVVGGFLVGFGTRYAGGCTSGHAIMGLSTLQWPSLVATICFMVGGILMAQFVLPFILQL
jgi:uncharacterized membrane protein YedE/YeeE